MPCSHCAITNDDDATVCKSCSERLSTREFVPTASTKRSSKRAAGESFIFPSPTPRPPRQLQPAERHLVG